MPLEAKRDADFYYDVVVDCPRCAAAAVMLRQPPPPHDPLNHAWRVTCVHCGFARDHAPFPSAQPRLRLRAVTRHGELTFYNLAHLDYVAEYIKAERRQVVFTDTGPRNSSITSRLLRWAKAGANRQEILQALDRARQKVF